MRSISVSQAQEFDRQAQARYGIPSLILMENAGRSVAEEAIKMLRGGKRIVVVCGAGNNGGDGLVAARHLANAGIKIKVFLLGKTTKLKPDPKTNLMILKKLKQKVIKVNSVRDLKGILEADLILDAVFGIGLKSNVRSPIFEVIHIMNKSKKPILSVDVPSGLDADSGKALGIAVKARRTVTFVASKKGFSRANAWRFCGRIVVRDIGVV